VKNIITQATTAAAMTDANWVRPPTDSTAAVREPLALTGRPWVTPAVKFASPRAHFLIGVDPLEIA
jgi:hypothetical protein